MAQKIIRSNRRTLALELKMGELIVRAPFQASDAEIESFIKKHSGWIEKHLNEFEKSKGTDDGIEPLSIDEIRALADEARRVIPERVRYYAPMVGVTYGEITIRSQRTKWGSCSTKGNLNFNCLLMLTPQEALDSVVVHELCHLKEMNHSEKFYAEVLRVYPEYRIWKKWLNDNTGSLMQRLPRQ